MSIAQSLYEGVELGQEGPEGLITYMRTDSVRIANEAIEDARKLINNVYGSQYLPESAIHFLPKRGPYQIMPRTTDETIEMIIAI